MTTIQMNISSGPVLTEAMLKQALAQAKAAKITPDEWAVEAFVEHLKRRAPTPKSGVSQMSKRTRKGAKAA